MHACFALRDAGCETIMVNSNPETMSTDYDTIDRLYFEPLTVEDALHIYHRERCCCAIVQFGGQTPLNLAPELERSGVNIIGTRPDRIDMAERLTGAAVPRIEHARQEILDALAPYGIIQ